MKKIVVYYLPYEFIDDLDFETIQERNELVKTNFNSIQYSLEEFCTSFNNEEVSDLGYIAYSTEEETTDELKEKHEAIRKVLIDYGSEEFGDCIIDDICNAVGLEPTTTYYEEE